MNMNSVSRFCSALVLSFLLFSCGPDEPAGGGGNGPEATHLMSQSGVIETTSNAIDFGVPVLNGDNSVSFVQKVESDWISKVTVSQTGRQVSKKQPTETQIGILNEWTAINPRASLDNGHTVRFAAETESGGLWTLDPNDPFYLYMYVIDGQEEIQRIKIKEVDWGYNVSSNTFYTNYVGGKFTYTDDNKIHFTYSYIHDPNSNPRSLRNGLLVINSAYEVELDIIVPDIFVDREYEGTALSDPMPSVFQKNDPDPSGSINTAFPVARAYQPFNHFFQVIRASDFYYVIGLYDHYPGFSSGNQVYLRADVRMHVMKYDLNGQRIWEINKKSKWSDGQGRYYYIPRRFLLTPDDELLYAGSLDGLHRSMIGRITPTGDRYDLHLFGFIKSFAPLGNGKIGLNGIGYTEDRSVSFWYTGVLNPDLTFENTDADNYPGFLY